MESVGYLEKGLKVGCCVGYHIGNDGSVIGIAVDLGLVAAPVVVA
jgi:hypothetical protein